jgi:hypothetical protein
VLTVGPFDQIEHEAQGEAADPSDEKIANDDGNALAEGSYYDNQGLDGMGTR